MGKGNDTHAMRVERERRIMLENAHFIMKNDTENLDLVARRLGISKYALVKALQREKRGT